MWALLWPFWMLTSLFGTSSFAQEFVFGASLVFGIGLGALCVLLTGNLRSEVIKTIATLFGLYLAVAGIWSAIHVVSSLG